MGILGVFNGEGTTESFEISAAFGRAKKRFVRRRDSNLFGINLFGGFQTASATF